MSNASDPEASREERLTVLIPCLNEEHNVEATVRSVLDVGATLPIRVEAVAIDDGSSDGTRAVIERLAAEHDNVRAQINPHNMGLGRSVMRAYEDLTPDTWVSVIPGDNEYDFSSIRNFVAVRERYDIVLGYISNPIIRSFGRRLASTAYTRIASTLYGFNFRYLNGFKMYRVRCFQGIEVVSSGHAYVSELLAKAILRDPHIRIGEAPFILRGRAAGESKALRPRSIVQAVREVMVGKRSVDAFRRKVISE